ncbi:hypothetical protein [Tateyamaria omphalii]|uniref:hypothetical protein n=1 Tax=Tateyamaria omphalii TaxID=299262 RepID=UPI00167BA455|nr:hypothetical protein [Tateyamaria omphalii]
MAASPSRKTKAAQKRVNTIEEMDLSITKTLLSRAHRARAARVRTQMTMGGLMPLFALKSAQSKPVVV